MKASSAPFGLNKWKVLGIVVTRLLQYLEPYSASEEEKTRENDSEYHPTFSAIWSPKLRAD